MQIDRPAREYVRRFHYDTLAFWPEARELPRRALDIQSSQQGLSFETRRRSGLECLNELDVTGNRR